MDTMNLSLTNKLFLSFFAVAVLVGGYALIQSSGMPAEAAVTQQHNIDQNDVDEPGDIDTIDDSDMNDDANESDGEQNDAEEAQVTPQPGNISEAQAKSIATAAYKGNGKITEVGLEMDGGIQVYAVEFTEQNGNEVDVKINAKTGAVVKVESDVTETPDDE